MTAQDWARLTAKPLPGVLALKAIKQCVRQWLKKACRQLHATVNAHPPLPAWTTGQWADLGYWNVAAA